MKIIVIGAVAAGTSAAAKARRNAREAEIVIYEKDQDISYAGCGLPYYIGDEVKDIATLTPRSPEFFKNQYNVDIKIRHEVLKIDTEARTLDVKNLETGEVFRDHYDKLVIATGASSFVPPVEGVRSGHVFFLRNVQDALRMKAFVQEKKPAKAVIAGTGFIGFEVLENLMQYGIEAVVVEVMDKITPNLDVDMAEHLEKLLSQKGIRIMKSTTIKKIEESRVVLSDGSALEADMVVMATGVRPNVALAKEAGIQLGTTGAIKVDEAMETSVKGVYACGDCIETFSVINGKPVYRPLGSTANKTGRVAGDAMTGGHLRYRGNNSTGIFKLFDWAIASTGFSEKEAIAEGYDVVTAWDVKPDKPHYFDGRKMAIKSIADRKTGRLLGAQIIGEQGVDRRIDAFAILITYGAKAEDLAHLDLAYAPPFSTTTDPVHYTGMVLEKNMKKGQDA